jgi:agmatinase
MAPTTWASDSAWSIQLDTEPYAHLAVVDAGDAPIVPTRPERALRVIHQKVRQVASHGAIPIVLGGDHSITYPSAAAVSRHAWPGSVGVIHFRCARRHGSRPVGEPLRATASRCDG